MGSLPRRRCCRRNGGGLLSEGAVTGGCPERRCSPRWLPPPLPALISDSPMRVSPRSSRCSRSSSTSHLLVYPGAHMIKQHKIWDCIKGTFEPFDLPGLPHPLRLNMARMPWLFMALCWEEFRNEMRESEKATDGDKENMAARGNKACTDEKHRVLRWLDDKAMRSISFGSLIRHGTVQLMEICYGLEASDQAFEWVIQNVDASSASEMDKWLSVVHLMQTLLSWDGTERICDDKVNHISNSLRKLNPKIIPNPLTN
ncbi:UDP-glycosyltransferase 73C3-like [Canna indica]|uniref:UDP-glycosyltransferase 73C3-like n=1 Tax=Canna indica TaxID=4628 RepID=A0AAQ3JRG7_9LILI|nr:UDP-glycosyltransferase 73C3-like [Canna indica]